MMLEGKSVGDEGTESGVLALYLLLHIQVYDPTGVKYGCFTQVFFFHMFFSFLMVIASPIIYLSYCSSPFLSFKPYLPLPYCSSCPLPVL